MTSETTEPKALTLQECKDIAGMQYVGIDYNDLPAFNSIINVLEKAAELYKESAISSYKAELKAKIDSRVAINGSAADSYTFGKYQAFNEVIEILDQSEPQTMKA